jgi:hypothetical protein
MSNKNQNDSDEKPIWERVLKLLLEHITLAGIAAVIAALAGLIAIVWPDIAPILFPTPTPIVSPTVTEVWESPTVLPSPTSIPTPSAEPTDTPTPPAPATTPTPTPIPLADQFDEFDDFTSMVLDPSRWHTVRGTTTVLRDGSLFLNVATSGDEWVNFEVDARLADRQARVVAAEVVVVGGTSPGQAGIIAGPVPPDTDGYVNFGIYYDGDIYVQQGTVGDPEPQCLAFLAGDVGQPHVLRIEWTGTEVAFEVDDERLAALETNKPLRWFGFSAGTRGFSYIEDRFNWVGWDWHP